MYVTTVRFLGCIVPCKNKESAENMQPPPPLLFSTKHGVGRAVAPHNVERRPFFGGIGYKMGNTLVFLPRIFQLCIINDTLRNPEMKKPFDKHFVYEFSNEDIVTELCKKIKLVRLSCCFSQQELADKSGVSVITVKRIESLKVNDITLGTLLKIMRVSGLLEGIVDLLPDLPASPFLIDEKSGKRLKRFNSKRKAL